MKICIKTWGCSANQSDSEMLAGTLKAAGHSIVSKPEKADIIILNTCIVKNRVEVDEIKEVKKFERIKPIIVTGCMAQATQIIQTYKKYLQNVSLLGIWDQSEIARAVESVKSGKRVVWISKKPYEKLCSLKIRKNKTIEICQIATGCLSNCSFCATKFAKGNLFSFSKEKILSQIKSALAEGCKEIWLTAQDCGAYGLDCGTNLPELLQEISNLKGEFFVRVGMANPQWIKKYKKELIECFKKEKIFKFLHIPVQSGSNSVLKAMLRGYKVSDFKEIISAFKKEIPNITISTDIICGYPTETERDWKSTIKLIKWLKPDVINISQFWPRQGTLAAKLPQLPGEIKKARSRELTKLYDKIALERNKAWLGWKGKVLIDEIGPKGGFIARNYAYKPIVLNCSDVKPGMFVKCKIIEAKSKYLIGKLIRN
ncbi:MAG: tRNA (N(6)-L-threonylcarbamoyladenosine(37)-C(2))-methylthiotransferase [Candidatus Nanoarchaeia archaeon]